MDSLKRPLILNSVRRFGSEIEVNAFDMLSRPADRYKLPKGTEYIANLVQKTTNDVVVIHKWGNDHHNDSWIIKPDGSCGMEVCSPVVKGWNGVMRIVNVIDAFSKDDLIKADSRCSFHVHVDVSDLTEEQIASILTWWIKCEPVFMDSVPLNRKRNEYCQFIGQSDMFDIEAGLISNENLIRKLGYIKYYSINAFHYRLRNRKTIEFRIMDNECCLNPWMAKNWLRLILHFVERAINRGLPLDYKQGDKWSGYCWLDPLDVFYLLGFINNQYDLSPGLEQVKNWFYSRIYSNINSEVKGLCSSEARRIAISQINDLMKDYVFLSGTNEEIYDNKYRI